MSSSALIVMGAFLFDSEIYEKCCNELDTVRDLERVNTIKGQLYYAAYHLKDLAVSEWSTSFEYWWSFFSHEYTTMLCSMTITKLLVEFNHFAYENEKNKGSWTVCTKKGSTRKIWSMEICSALAQNMLLSPFKQIVLVMCIRIPHFLILLTWAIFTSH